MVLWNGFNAVIIGTGAAPDKDLQRTGRKHGKPSKSTPTSSGRSPSTTSNRSPNAWLSAVAAKRPWRAQRSAHGR